MIFLDPNETEIMIISLTSYIVELIFPRGNPDLYLQCLRISYVLLQVTEYKTG